MYAVPRQHMIHNTIPGAPINIKIVANIPGYPVELNRHNALTFSQHAAPGYPVLVPATIRGEQPNTDFYLSFVKTSK